ncbi:pre-mRNA-splicing factor ISY1-like [Spatholobus suberectus]|nr:pre-mRNA-splicing factor ISY1-like [Spatholobus suberectus]
MAKTRSKTRASREHCLHDLNDKINKLIRKKSHWQHRFHDLDGNIVDIPNPGNHELFEMAPKLHKHCTCYFGYRNDEDDVFEE